MGLNNLNSDYGSGSSTSSSTHWLNQDHWPAFQTQQVRDSERPRAQRSTSIVDLAMGRCTLGDVMKEFSMNGFDSPYNPEDDKPQTDKLSGLGPGSAYLRQKSWPAPERSPAQRLPRPAPEWIPSVSAKEFTSSTPVNEPPAPELAGPQQTEYITEEQVRVLSSLPDSVLYPLLRELEHARGDLDRRATRRQPDECRFCKNNGERESYYRSHQLKDAAGRVACPVLRAFVCRRCGARGDSAHTIKYCPLSTQEERMKSAAMMRSVRMASGRRRCAPLATSVHNKYLMFGDTTPSIVQDSNVYSAYENYAPLDPVWAALEQKLML